jgi:hypothetical protein
VADVPELTRNSSTNKSPEVTPDGADVVADVPLPFVTDPGVTVHAMQLSSYHFVGGGF